ncbi:MAG: hypothetical protein ABIG43_03615 [Chloroflexota bacterium]
METQRSSWYLLTGLILGLVLGLVFTWVVSPVSYSDSNPDSLREDFKNHYRSMIAQVYAKNANLLRAESRLMLLGDEDTVEALSAQAQRILAEGGSENEARALAALAAAFTNQTIKPEATSGSPAYSESAEPVIPTNTLPPFRTATAASDPDDRTPSPEP